MKTQTFFKLAIAILLVLEIQLLNFHQDHIERSSTRIFRCAALTSTITKVDDSITLPKGATQLPYPSVAQYGDGFVIAYTSGSDIYISAYGSDYSVITNYPKKIVTHATDQELLYPSIAQLTGGSYIVCYQQKTTTTTAGITGTSQTTESSSVSNSETISGSEPDSDSISIKYMTPCIPLSTTLTAGTKITDITGLTSGIVYPTFPSVYALTSEMFGVLVNAAGQKIYGIPGTYTGSAITPKYKITITPVSSDSYPVSLVGYTYSSSQCLALVYADSGNDIYLITVNIDTYTTDQTVYTQFALIASDTLVYTRPTITVLTNGNFFITYDKYVSGSPATHQILYTICDPTVTFATKTTLCTSGQLTNSLPYPYCTSSTNIVLSNDQLLFVVSCKASGSSVYILKATLYESDISNIIKTWTIFRDKEDAESFSWPDSTLLTDDRVLITWQDETADQIYGAVYSVSSVKTTSASSDMQNYKIVSLAYLALALLFILML